MLKQVQHDVRPYTRVFQTYFSFIVRRYSSLIIHYSLLITQSSLLIAQCSLLKSVCQDAKPVRANSRGFSNPWNNDMKKIWRLQRRGRAVRVADSRLYRRHYCVVIKNRRLESPRLFIFPSFRRIFSHNSLLTAHRSSPKGVCQDAKPVRANSRGVFKPVEY